MRRTARFVLPALAGCLIAGTALAANWERFRGPNASGVAADKDVPVKFGEKENVLWKVPIPGKGNSSPVVWGDRVFLQTASKDAKQRTLVCLDADTGKVVWQRSIPGVKPNHSVRPDSSLASSTPTTDGEMVYVSFWDGRDIIVAAYDMKGSPRWSKNLGPFISQHGAGASPILYKDKLILANDMDREDAKKRPVARPAVLVAFNKKTGDVAWEAPREAFRACYSAPLLRQEPGAAPELIVTSTTAITGYDPETGSKNWEFTDWHFTGKKGTLRTVATPILVDGMLVASSGDGGGDRHGIGITLKGTGTATAATRVWENRKDLPYVPCPVARGGNVFMVNDAGYAGCFEARTGKQVWLERLPDARFYASPLLIDGKIYAFSEQGDAFVFAADSKLHVLARNTLGDRIVASPAVADGRLYVRGAKYLYCIGKK
jgi:outer membrane protein assembly factor BamB